MVNGAGTAQGTASSSAASSYVTGESCNIHRCERDSPQPERSDEAEGALPYTAACFGIRTTTAAAKPFLSEPRQSDLYPFVSDTRWNKKEC
jgi:hypothetical protein